MRSKLHIGRTLIPVLALGLLSGAAVVLAQQGMPGIAPLAPLKNALRIAGTPELTPEQEENIQALIKEFRDTHQRPIQNEDIQNARMAYEEAILKGDLAAAASQAEVLGRYQATEIVQRESDAAAFVINVIGILKADPGQADALISQMGTRGFVRMILSLAGGPGGPGPRGGRPPLPPGFVAP